MKRRKFLILGSLLGLSPYIEAEEISDFKKQFIEIEPTLRAVQEHLFPEGSNIPSAKSMQLTQFLFQTMMHESFDKDIKAFVFEGAKELERREKGAFVSLSDVQKEKALREYENTEHGNSWLSRMMTLSLEGLLSDPIYGSNVHEQGWNAISAYGGFPRPRSRYIEL
jgi:gluconate 2-dehydrogenase gamma chain